METENARCLTRFSRVQMGSNDARCLIFLEFILCTPLYNFIQCFPTYYRMLEFNFELDVRILTQYLATRSKLYFENILIQMFRQNSFHEEIHQVFEYCLNYSREV